MFTSTQTKYLHISLLAKTSKRKISHSQNQNREEINIAEK